MMSTEPFYYTYELVVEILQMHLLSVCLNWMLLQRSSTG
jgi:hypothetical protein